MGGEVPANLNNGIFKSIVRSSNTFSINILSELHSLTTSALFSIVTIDNLKTYEGSNRPVGGVYAYNFIWDGG